ncbi:DUF86 domain-containing protein [Candidatus Pacearchaeota archaeon]|nr:DUF86 domain-containing protein [Candidatus Pacearchaeota archaeon]
MQEKSLYRNSKSIKDQDAIIRRFEIIGEAIKSLPEDFKNNYPNINFKGFEKARDFLSHVYFGVNVERLYLMIEKDLPILEREILKIKKEL